MAFVNGIEVVEDSKLPFYSVGNAFKMPPPTGEKEIPAK
jgi:hypothetical protein